MLTAALVTLLAAPPDLSPRPASTGSPNLSPQTAPAAAPNNQPPQPAPPPGEPTPRQLRIAGGITLGLAGAALGLTIARTVAAAAVRRKEDIVTDAAAGREPTAAEQDALGELHDRRAAIRNQAIGIGLAGAALTAVGVVLLVAGHRLARRTRVSLAPWWLPGGAGVVLHLRLGRLAAR